MGWLSAGCQITNPGVDSPSVPSTVLQISALHGSGFRKIKFISQNSFPFCFLFFFRFCHAKQAGVSNKIYAFQDMDFTVFNLIKDLNTHQMIPLYPRLRYAVSNQLRSSHVHPCLFLLYWLLFPFEIILDGVHL